MCAAFLYNYFITGEVVSKQTGTGRKKTVGIDDTIMMRPCFLF